MKKKQSNSIDMNKYYMHVGMVIVINDIINNIDSEYVEKMKDDIMNYFREIYPIEMYDLLEKTMEEYE